MVRVRIEYEKQNEQMQNILYDLRDIAEEGWEYEDRSFGHEFGTEICGSWEYTSPDIEPIEVVVPAFPIPDPWDEGNTIENCDDLLKSIQEIVENIDNLETEQGKLRLIAGYTLHREYGSQIKTLPFEILKIRPEWEEV